MQETIAGQVWFIRGDEYATPFATKMDAEIAARIAFPDEDEATRYGRIYYRSVVHYV